MPDLLPINATTQERAISLAVDRLPDVPIKTLWTPQTCPEAQLPWLAWALSVDEWDAAWPIETKRQAVADSIEQHRKKGTVGALRRALQRLGYEVEIDEQTGVAYTFRLRFKVREGESAGGAVAEDALNRAVVVALRQKNVRSSLLETLYIAETDAAGLFIGGVTMSGLSYEAKETGAFLPAPTSITFSKLSNGSVTFSWLGDGDSFETEIRIRSTGELIDSATAFVNSINFTGVPVGEFYFYIRALTTEGPSVQARLSFNITVSVPFDVTLTNEASPRYLLTSFKCNESQAEYQICAHENGWIDNVLNGEVNGFGLMPWTSSPALEYVDAGFYDLRVRSKWNGTPSSWVYVYNVEALPEA